MMVGMLFNNHCCFKKRQSTGGFQGTKEKVRMGAMSTSEKNSTGHSITPHRTSSLSLHRNGNREESLGRKNPSAV